MDPNHKYAVSIVDVSDKPLVIRDRTIQGWTTVEEYLNEAKEVFGTVSPLTITALRVAAENGSYQDNEIQTQKNEEYTVYTVCIEGPIE